MTLNYGQERFVMEYQARLIQMIEKSADELTNRWLADVRRSAKTTTYHSFNEKDLYQRGHRVLSHLGLWITEEIDREESRKYWINLGRERRKEGFALSEILQALALLRRNLWQKVESEGLMDTAYDFFQAMQLHDRVTHFFDRAVYYTACGYESSED
jgi:hypothetical protein